jgi:UDP-N-acetylglucosamine:LPS N-acetylglucosamine transferase
MLVEVGGAEMMLEKNLSGEGLAKLLMKYMDDRTALERMGKRAQEMGQPDAAKVIVDQLMEMMRQS